MMDMIHGIILAVFASSGFWSLMIAIHQKRREKKGVDRQALLALLHDRIFELASSYLSHGSISTEELENLQCLFEPYEKMGGNGTCHKLMIKIDNLVLEQTGTTEFRTIGGNHE